MINEKKDLSQDLSVNFISTMNAPYKCFDSSQPQAHSMENLSTLKDEPIGGS